MFIRPAAIDQATPLGPERRPRPHLIPLNARREDARSARHGEISVQDHDDRRAAEAVLDAGVAAA